LIQLQPSQFVALNVTEKQVVKNENETEGFASLLELVLPDNEDNEETIPADEDKKEIVPVFAESAFEMLPMLQNNQKQVIKSTNTMVSHQPVFDIETGENKHPTAQLPVEVNKTFKSENDQIFPQIQSFQKDSNNQMLIEPLPIEWKEKVEETEIVSKRLETANVKVIDETNKTTYVSPEVLLTKQEHHQQELKVANHLNGAAITVPSDSIIASEGTNSIIVEPKQFVHEFGKLLTSKLHMQHFDGTIQAKFALRPEHLGHIDVMVKIQDGQVVAQFVADTSAGKEMIESQIETLKHALQEQGLQVNKVDVYDQTRSFLNQHSQQGGTNAFNQRQQQKRSYMNREKAEEALQSGFAIEEHTVTGVNYMA
jgi:flagellar hook-length control protein FliK